MKIMISNDGPHAHYYIRLGWAKVFQAIGHEVAIWDKALSPSEITTLYNGGTSYAATDPSLL